MTVQATWLLASLFVAHFLGDFTPLTTQRMLEAKARGKPVGPIAAHAGVHAVLVGFVVGGMARPGGALLVVAVAVEFLTHLGIDWAKGRLGAARPAWSDPRSRSFWWIFGVDQLGHQLVLIAIAVLVS